MTNVQKAYNAVFREEGGAANFNMIFPTLGAFHKQGNMKIKGIDWFKGRRKQIDEWGIDDYKTTGSNSFRFFISAKLPRKRKFRLYSFLPSDSWGDDETPLLQETEFIEWFGGQSFT
jgi:hypothetical protein